jgi:hypothetical protein
MIFDHVIKNSSEYDAPIREKLRDGESVELLCLELPLEDVTRGCRLVLADP